LNQGLAPDGELLFATKTLPGFRPTDQPYRLFKFAPGEFVRRLGNRSLLTLSTYIIHRDVVAAIAPSNLAAFPPSLEVNADIA